MNWTAAWTCILECADGSYCVGSTIDLYARAWQHNEGLGAACTRHRRPVKVVWSAQFDRVDEAFAYEKRVQGWSRRKREALISGDWQIVRQASRRLGGRPRT